MNTLLHKSVVCLFFIAGIATAVYGQENSTPSSGRPFIHKGTILTGFSFAFTNASRSRFNQDFEREFTSISAQLDGLYFVNDRLGIGPLLGYEFTYRDLVDAFQRQSDIDTRQGQFKFGAQAGWYIPFAQIVGGDSNTDFFINGGLSWLRDKFRRENGPEPHARYEFGFQASTGFLFPVGKQIALKAALGFQTRRSTYRFQISRGPDDSQAETFTKRAWTEEVALTLGLEVAF